MSRSSSISSSDGLGIILYQRDDINGSRYSQSSRSRLSKEQRTRRPPTAAFFEKQNCVDSSSSTNTFTTSVSYHAGLRSLKDMDGLIRAEVGDSMVQFHAGSGRLREGSRFALDPMTPGGSIVATTHDTTSRLQRPLSVEAASVPQDISLFNLAALSAPVNSKGLASLLGNSNARLKPGAKLAVVGHPQSRDAGKERGVALEHAKSRARVEVDIVLDDNVCVQGGELRGHVKLRIRKRSKKDGSILLADGKIRLIGYETIPGVKDRHIFYRCASPVATISNNLQRLYSSAVDKDGFAHAVEGVHSIPFVMPIPAGTSAGSAKGMIRFQSGVSLNYIAMISIKVKTSGSEKRSIAHFYRQCEVWPRLDPRIVLQPAPRPLQASTTKSMSFIGGTNYKVKFSARLSRLHWPAGTKCPVSVCISNGSKKTIRSLTLTLVRTATLFFPRPVLDADGDRDIDSCQTSTTHKVVAECVLEMGNGVAKGHASAKGWWTGVAPGQVLELSHYILLPPDALSVTRSRLLEIEYSIQVTLKAGYLASDIRVTLPVRIFNFLSIDHLSNVVRVPARVVSSHSEQEHMGRGDTLYDPKISSSPDELEYEMLLAATSNARSLCVTNPDAHSPAASSRLQSRSSSCSFTSTDVDVDSDVPEGCEALDIDEDAGSDEEIDEILSSVLVDTHPSSFKSSDFEAQERDQNADSQKRPTRRGGRLFGARSPKRTSELQRQNTFARRVEEKKLKRLHSLRGGPSQEPQNEDEPTPRVVQQQFEGCKPLDIQRVAVKDAAEPLNPGSSSSQVTKNTRSESCHRREAAITESESGMPDMSTRQVVPASGSRTLPRPPSITPTTEDKRSSYFSERITTSNHRDSSYSVSESELVVSSRPTWARRPPIRNSGGSVQGRIAELESKIRAAQDSGEAYV